MRFIFNLLICAISMNAFAQARQGAYLDVNNHLIRVHANGAIGHDGYTSHQFIPSEDSLSTLAASHLWMAVDHLDYEYRPQIAAERYRASGSSWSPGPVHPYESVSESPNRVWKIDAATIDEHVANYTSSSYTMPEVIEKWPANEYPFGDIPFNDIDGDSIYEPEAGEYPLIKGNQAILAVFANSHHFGPYPGILLDAFGPLVNVYMLVYGYSCPTTPAIDDAFFIHYKVRRVQGVNSKVDLSLGVWSDLNIGNPFDDFIASDVERNMYYAYNGDANDESQGGFEGFGTATAAHGVVFLKGLSLADNGQDDNSDLNGWGFGDGTIDNERLGLTRFIAHDPALNSNTGAPDVGDEYAAIMTGHWKDSTLVTYGGNGYGGSQPARYMYPGTSDPNGLGVGGNSVTIWDEPSEGNTPGDRMGIGMTGPITLESDWETVEIEIAQVFARQSSQLSAVESLKAKVDLLQQIYLQGGGACNISFALGEEEEVKQASIMRVFPNPTSGIVSVIRPEPDALVEVFSLTGSKLLSSTSEYLNLSGLAPGTYILKCGEQHQRIVKQ